MPGPHLKSASTDGFSKIWVSCSTPWPVFLSIHDVPFVVITCLFFVKLAKRRNLSQQGRHASTCIIGIIPASGFCQTIQIDNGCTGVYT